MVWEGTKIANAEQANLFPLFSQLIYDFLDQACDATEGDQNIIGVLYPMAFGQPCILSSEDLGEALFRLFYCFCSIQQPNVFFVFEHNVVCGSCGESKVTGMFQIKFVFCLKSGEKGIRLFRCRDIDYLVGMCQDKAVQICHKRRGDVLFFRYVIAHQRKVERFLRVNRIRLDPTTVKL